MNNINTVAVLEDEKLPFEIKDFAYKMVLDIHEKIDMQLRSQKCLDLSPREHIYLNKYLLQAKAILLMSYRHCFTYHEIANLKLTDLCLVEGSVQLCASAGRQERPLKGLELVYNKALTNWYRLRLYEEPKEYLFAHLLFSGELFPGVMNFQSYRTLQMLLTIASFSDLNLGIKYGYFPGFSFSTA